jgi:hypothetical protein
MSLFETSSGAITGGDGATMNAMEQQHRSRVVADSYTRNETAANISEFSIFHHLARYSLDNISVLSYFTQRSDGCYFLSRTRAIRFRSLTENTTGFLRCYFKGPQSPGPYRLV